MDRATIVTGAGGFIGGHVATLLEKSDRPFVGVLSPASKGPPAWRAWRDPASFVKVDLRDLAGVRALLDRVRPSRIINLASVGVSPSYRPDVAEVMDVNARLPAVLFEQMPEDCVLVHVGSMYERANPEGLFTEDALPDPARTLYGYTKAVADGMLDRLSAEHPERRCVRARLFLACGAGEKPHRLIPAIVAAARAGKEVPLSDGLQVRDLLHAEDAAQGLLHVSHCPSLHGRSVNVARGQASTIRYVAERAAARLQATPLLRFGALPRRPNEPQEVIADTLRIAATGWTPHLTLDETIDRAVDEMLR